MKIVAKIPPKKFRCPEGRLTPEGKKASPPFCYRIKIGRKKIKESHSMLAGRVMVVEFDSRVTGRRIGYFGTLPEKPIVPDMKKARRFVEGQFDRSLPIYDTPELMDKMVQDFIKVGQDPGSNPLATPQYKRAATNAWKILLREAKK